MSPIAIPREEFQLASVSSARCLDAERLRPPPVRTKENPSFCPVDMNMRMRGKDDAPARKKVAFWVSEGLSEHKSKGSQRHNSQWVEMSNIGLTTKVLVQRHIA